MRGVLIEVFGGLPFLDSGFKGDLLCQTIAGVRQRLAPHFMGVRPEDGTPLQHWLMPEGAQVLREAMGIECDLLPNEMTEEDAAKVHQSRTRVVDLVPSWSDLIWLPMSFHETDRPGVESCSCYAQPQRTYLSREVLDGDAVRLDECIVHEACHNWMYMLEELEPFHDHAAQPMFVLPSGTGNRNPTEVIGACHVVLTLIAFYKQVPGEGSRHRRMNLQRYASGCVEMLNSMGDDVLRPSGMAIRGALAAHLDKAWDQSLENLEETVVLEA